MSTTTLLRKFHSTRPSAHKCSAIYCSTCGGKAAAIKNVRDDFIPPLCEVLGHADLDDIIAFGPWLEVVAEISPQQLAEALVRAADKIDQRGIEYLDKFIFASRRFSSLSLGLSVVHAKCLKHAQEVAITTENISLLETLILTMGEELLEEPDFLSFVLSRKDNPVLGKALYNTLRSRVPEVRVWASQRSWKKSN